MDHHAVNDEALDRIFRAARTQNTWRDTPVSTALLMAVYDLARMGPTSANCSPARLVFLTTPEAKARLAAHASHANKPKILAAPVTAIVGYDLDFAQKLPELFPHDQTAKTWFADPAVEQVTAFRNGTLQGAYLMIAARAIGLDVGGMSGFDNAKVDAAFFPDGRFKTNFLCNLGYGDHAKLFNRSPRLEFEEAVTLA
jgi:3-hydroxypropanoate dehydrogenase